MARACKEPVELRLREFSDEDVDGHAKLVALELARRAAEEAAMKRLQFRGFCTRLKDRLLTKYAAVEHAVVVGAKNSHVVGVVAATVLFGHNVSAIARSFSPTANHALVSKHAFKPNNNTVLAFKLASSHQCLTSRLQQSGVTFTCTFTRTVFRIWSDRRIAIEFSRADNALSRFPFMACPKGNPFSSKVRTCNTAKGCMSQVPTTSASQRFTTLFAILLRGVIKESTLASSIAISSFPALTRITFQQFPTVFTTAMHINVNVNNCRCKARKA